MEHNRIFHSTVLASTAIFLFILVSFSSMASASTVQDTQLSLTETQLITNEFDQAWPAIYGDKIVWSDNRSGNWDIYVHYLSTGQETQLTTDKSDQAWPAIYGDRIVWADNRSGNWDIYLYNLSTKEETQVTTNGFDQYSPAVYGDKIVWADNRNGNWDIYLYDLSTKEETQVTTNGFDQYSPAIYGNRIVWVDDCNGWENHDIYSYNLSTHEETQITTNMSDQMVPSIWDDRIVWQDDRNGNWDIYMYNLSTREERQITTNESDQCHPAINGDWIVWTDDRNGNWDIYMYGLSTSNETQITTNQSDQVWPAISGNRIVWQDHLNGNWDVFMCTGSGNGPESYVVPQSVSNIQASTGPDWINWTWTNPSDPSFNHTEIYLNGTFKINTSAEYFNATDLQPETNYTLGTRTADQYGNVNETWINASAKTGSLPDTTSPVIESVILSPTSTTTGSTINVTVNVTDNIGVSDVKANDISLLNQGGNTWNGSITALEGTHSINVSAMDRTGNVAWDNSTSYTAATPDNIPPSSIADLQFTNGITWVNWTWSNPTDPDFNHTEIYLNGIFQTDTSDGYFNATGLQPETSSTLSTRTVDNNGNVNETWVNSTVTTGKVIVPIIPAANFSSNITEGYAPLDVQFTSLSTNATDLQWNFGDGSSNTSVANPEHVFTSTGLFDVVLTASNANGSDSKSMTINVTSKSVVPLILPVANFSSNVTEGYAPLEVQFNDSSENAAGVSWDFDNDGLIDSTDRNPINEYATPGNYTVNLTAANANGTNSKLASINVSEKPMNFSNKVTLDDTSPVSPALASFNDRLYLAWKGNSNNYLNVMYSTDDGNTFRNKYTSPETSPESPALCAHNGSLYIAWKGNGNNFLNVAQVTVNGDNITGFSNKVTLGDTSPVSPALASFNGRLYLAWKGNSNNYLNVMYSTDDGKTFRNKYTSPETSPESPALSVHNGSLYIAWKGNGNDNLNVAQVTMNGDNITGFSNKAILNDTSPVSPALASFNDRLYLAWNGNGNNYLNDMYSVDGGKTFGNKYTSPETSPESPALCAHNGRLYIAWKGNGNNNLNVAQVI